MRKFPIIPVIVVAIALGIVLTIVWRGTKAHLEDKWIVNPIHSSSAEIEVLATYFGSNPDRNIYRVYAKVIEDSDNTPHFETFEISDSFLDGNYRSSDIFGQLTANVGTVFVVQLRGERSGIQSSFRHITEVGFDPRDK